MAATISGVTLLAFFELFDGASFLSDHITFLLYHLLSYWLSMLTIHEDYQSRGIQSHRQDLRTVSLLETETPSHSSDGYAGPIITAAKGASTLRPACGSCSSSATPSYHVPLLRPFDCRPPAAKMAAMLQREQQLRLADATQVAYACEALPDPAAINHLLQLTVVREFGYPDSYVRFLRAASSEYSREELPWEALPHYVRFNRR